MLKVLEDWVPFLVLIGFAVLALRGLVKRFYEGKRKPAGSVGRWQALAVYGAGLVAGAGLGLWLGSEAGLAAPFGVGLGLGASVVSAPLIEERFGRGRKPKAAP